MSDEERFHQARKNRSTGGCGHGRDTQCGLCPFPNFEEWIEDQACPVCGNQERDHRGLLKCECPCPSTLESRRQIAPQMKEGR